MTDDSLKHLILAHLDGRLSDEEFTELQQRLETDSSVRALYAELARLDAELRETGAVADRMNEDANTGSEELWPRRIGWSGLPIFAQVLAVAAVLAVMLIPTWMLLQRGDGPVAETAEPISNEPVRSIAVISAEADAVWNADGEKRFGKGTALEPRKAVAD